VIDQKHGLAFRSLRMQQNVSDHATAGKTQIAHPPTSKYFRIGGADD
jgi:hypothetical protein